MKKTASAPVAEAADDAKKEVKPKSLFRKMVEDKEAMSDYVRGKITLSELNAKGIKLVKTI